MNLTKKESLVLYYFIKGFQRNQIASLAKISTSAFDFHISNIKGKFCVNTTNELKDAAYSRGCKILFHLSLRGSVELTF